MAVEIWLGETVKVSVTVKNTGTQSRNFGVKCRAFSENKTVTIGRKSTGLLSKGSSKTVEFYYTPTSTSETGYIDIKAYVYENSDCSGRLLDSAKRRDAVFVKYMDAKIVEASYFTLRHLCNYDTYARALIRNTGNVRATFYVFFAGMDPNSYTWNHHTFAKTITLDPGEEAWTDYFTLWECQDCWQTHCYNVLGKWRIKIIVSASNSYEHDVLDEYESTECTVIE